MQTRAGRSSSRRKESFSSQFLANRWNLLRPGRGGERTCLCRHCRVPTLRLYDYCLSLFLAHTHTHTHTHTHMKVCHLTKIHRKTQGQQKLLNLTTCFRSRAPLPQQQTLSLPPPLAVLIMKSKLAGSVVYIGTYICYIYIYIYRILRNRHCSGGKTW